jgi:glycosyltransferase involved in cell wall biosynthesis
MMVSIIIPTYNRANYLTKAIDSALAQDYSNIEVIVSDNASVDDTNEVIKRYTDNPRFKYFRNNKNLGMVANWRKALNNYATGDFFMILSDDDYLIDDDYISKAVKLIKSDQEIVIVYANGYLFYEDSNKMVEFILPFNPVESGKTIFLSRSKVLPQDFCLCNVLFKKNLALKLNAFSNDYNISCDSELFLKMCLYGKIGLIKDFVSVYQLHSENLIKVLKNDLILIVNNYDHLLEPYKLAKRLDIFSEEELREWENHILLSYLWYIIFQVMIYQDKNYKELIILLKEKDPEGLKKIQISIKFKISLFLYRIKIFKVIYKTKKLF